MDEVGKRGLLTYVFLSLAFLLLESLMRGIGANTRYNPAWLLISSIYTFFEWTWILGAGVAVLYFIGVQVFKIYEARENARKEREWEEKRQAEWKLRRVENIARIRHAKRTASEKRRLEAIKRKEERMRIHRTNKERREADRRRNPEQAVHAALTKLCKGEV